MQRLQRIVDAVPDLGPESRVMDVGSGTGCLTPHMQQRGVQDILAIDVAENMLAKVSNPAHVLLLLLRTDSLMGASLMGLPLSGMGACGGNRAAL